MSMGFMRLTAYCRGSAAALTVVVACGQPETASDSLSPVGPDPTQSLDSPGRVQVNRLDPCYVRDAEGIPSVISVHVEQVGWDVQGGVRVAFWANGRVVWSQDKASGGGAMYRARVREDVVSSLVVRLGAELDREGSSGRGRLGLHALNSILTIVGQEASYSFASFHENDEKETSDTNEEILWDRLWEMILQVVPDKGEPCELWWEDGVWVVR